MMEKHYFIGIKIPLYTAESLVGQRKAWGTAGHKRYPFAEDLHITLLFIGEDPKGEIMVAAEALEAVAHPKIDLRIAGSGFFGKKDRPRVVYAALEESPSLQELQQKIKGALSDFNLSPDNKAFVPHITLANKWAGKEPWDRIPTLSPESFQAKAFSLFRIDPSSTPRYTALKTYQLKDGV